MKKSHRLGIVALVALFATTTALVGTASGGQGADNPRPFRISVEFTGTVIGGPGSFGCDEASVPIFMTGGGHAAHMGKIDLEGLTCQNLETNALTDSSSTYVAANGDSAIVAFAGQGYLNPDGTYTGEGSSTFVSGTGRFASVTGDWTWTMTGRFLPDGTTQTSVEGDGWVAYDASDRNS